MKTVLLIGATGTFGSRLAESLARISGLHIVLAGRRETALQDLKSQMTEIALGTTLTCKAMDAQYALVPALKELKPWLVIDASGPFQFMDYKVPEAALEHGAHFLDLADAETYLLGFNGALNELAQSKDLVALAGASTTPALTHAVLRDLTKGWQRIDTVDIAIVPGGSSTVGPALVKAITAQAGVPVATFRHGRNTTTLGWLKSHEVTVPKLGCYRVTPVETVDAKTMPAMFNITSRMQFSAGLVSPLEQLGIQAIARLRTFGLFKNTNMLVAPLVLGRWALRHISHLNAGMIMTAQGLDHNGTSTESQWSLFAQKGHGPHVPTLACVASVRKLLAGGIQSGARMITNDLTREDIEAEMQHLSITTQVETRHAARSVFDNVLDAKAYASLKPAVQKFHAVDSPPVWRGEADVDRGINSISRLLGKFIGHPSAGRAIALCVSVERNGPDSETWTRQFGNQQFHSVMSFKNGRLYETFGPSTFHLGLASERGTAIFPVAAAMLWGIPLPRFLWPTSIGSESEDEQGRFQFDVKITLPIFGLLAHYRGWLTPEVNRSTDHDPQYGPRQTALGDRQHRRTTVPAA
jgi:hypothetical protein